MPKIKIHFLGASNTVTGSKFLIETQQKNILIDCGMFQGVKEIRNLNWCDLPFDTSSIDTVLITHGHLDHTGYLPRLVNQGFKGDIIGTPPTMEIAKIILLDSGKIHEEEAEKANKEKYSKHDPALPFYTIEDAEHTIGFFNTIDKNEWLELSKDIRCRFRYNGHILGACYIEIDIYGKRFVFSGDIGRINDPLLFPPDRPKWADYLFLESTYGDRTHPKDEFEDLVVRLIKDVIQNRGTLVIPSFAIERIQILMYLFWFLYKKNKIPNIPIFIDSPMGNNVIEVFKQFPEWHKLKYGEYQQMVRHFNIITSYQETWETIDDPRPKIVIAGSGMITGGRVLTYLKQLIDITTTNILLVGFQAEGTRGRDLIEGAQEIKFFGKYHPVKAKVFQLESLSAHADQFELIDWLKNIRNIPESVFLIHGESDSLEAFKMKIKRIYNWNVIIPKLHGIHELIV
jgi:metallo-beta-lactamase family protein